jgi:hypothetical protein
MKTQDLDRIRFITRHFADLQGLRYGVPLGLITLSAGGTTYFENPAILILRAILFGGAFLLMFGAKRYYRSSFGEVERRTVTEPCSLSIFNPAGSAPRLEGFEQVPPMARRLLIPLGLAFTLFFILQAVTPTIMIVESQSLAQPPWLTLDAVFLAHEPWTQGIDSIVRGTMISPSTAKAVLGQMMYALHGALFLGLWFWRGRRWSQSHYLVLGILLLGLSAFGTFLGYLVWQDGEIVRILNLFLPAVVHLWVALLLCGASMTLTGLLDHWQLVRTLRTPLLEVRP